MCAKTFQRESRSGYFPGHVETLRVGFLLDNVLACPARDIPSLSRLMSKKQLLMRPSVTRSSEPQMNDWSHWCGGQSVKRLAWGAPGPRGQVLRENSWRELWVRRGKILFCGLDTPQMFSDTPFSSLGLPTLTAPFPTPQPSLANWVTKIEPQGLGVIFSSAGKGLGSPKRAILCRKGSSECAWPKCLFLATT